MQTKVCVRCKLELPINSFYKDKKAKDKHFSYCKTCSRVAHKLWQASNKEHVNAKTLLWKQDNKEHVKLYMLEWREKNKEEIANKGKEYYKNNIEKITKSAKISSKKWRQANLAKQTQYSNIKRSLKKGLPSTLTTDEWGNTQKSFNYTCCYCGEEKLLEQEHFIALSSGGEYTHNNIIPSCKSCNCSKGSKEFKEWYPRYKHYDKKREKFILNYLGYKNDDTQQLSIL